MNNVRVAKSPDDIQVGPSHRHQQARDIQLDAKMEHIFPPNTPEGIAYTPALLLPPLAQVRHLGLITPLRNGSLRRSAREQTEDCISNLDEALTSSGREVEVVKLTRLMRDVREVWTTQPVIEKRFPNWIPPSTLLEVSACSVPGARVEFEVWVADRTSPQDLEPGSTEQSGGLENTIFIATPTTTNRDVVLQLETCLEQIEEELATSDQAQLCTLAVYIVDMRYWSACKDYMATKYASNAQAMFPIAVQKLLNPEALVTVVADILRPCSQRERVAVLSGSAALPVFSGGKASDVYSYTPEATIEAQTNVSMRNYEIMLKACGASWDNVVQTTWYVSDVREWPKIKDVVEKWFKRPIPRPLVLEVSKFVLPGVRIEPDMWAVVGANDSVDGV